MALDDYNVKELSKYRIKKRYKFEHGKNVEYFYAQYKTLFGWSYIDGLNDYSPVNSSSFGAVSVSIFLIMIPVVMFSAWASGEYYVFKYVPLLLLCAIIFMFIWMKIPHDGKKNVYQIKDIIENRIKYHNRKTEVEIFDVSIKVQRKKKLDKLNKISK